MVVKCPKCKSENVQKNGKNRRSGNWWYEGYDCNDCHHGFEQGEEVKLRGN